RRLCLRRARRGRLSTDGSEKTACGSPRLSRRVGTARVGPVRALAVPGVGRSLGSVLRLDLGEELGERLVHLVERGLLAPCGRLKACDQRRRVVDVVSGRNEIGVVPEPIAYVLTDGVTDRAPHRGRFAQPARAQLEAHEGSERVLRGAADGAAATRGL